MSQGDESALGNEDSDPGAETAPAFGTGYLNRIDAALTDSEISEGRPKMVGRYRLLERIGEGGMGSVFRAHQQSPIDRIVALKLIKLGLGSPEIVRRFESERQ